MTEKRLPTPSQQRLVNIGMVIQFHLAAIGHLVVWVWMLIVVLRTVYFDEIHNEWLTAVILILGIPISSGILVAVYILFRYLLAHAKFGTALITMIVIDVLHSVVMGCTIIVPLRLAIPIVLYSIALYSFVRTSPENMEPPDVS